MPKQTRDIGASVRARLLNLAHAKGQGFQNLLTRYVIERLLYRLSISPHRDRFVLKGAMLMTTWFDDPHRPTRDVDFLGYGDPTPEPMLGVFREVLSLEADDGVAFDAAALRVDLIREELEYGGLRLRTNATVSGACINVTIDIGFGDAVEPGVESIELPVLLDMPAPHLRAYARETVIAEKFQAMVALGLTNTRMKDFYDVWILSRSHEFEADRLGRAIAATFERRGTPIPSQPPEALTDTFATNAMKQQQWAAFSRDLTANAPSLEVVINDLVAFLLPFALEARRQQASRTIE